MVLVAPPVYRTFWWKLFPFCEVVLNHGFLSEDATSVRGARYRQKVRCWTGRGGLRVILFSSRALVRRESGVVIERHLLLLGIDPSTP